MCATLHGPQSSFKSCSFISPHTCPKSLQVGNHGQTEAGLFPRPHSGGSPAPTSQPSILLTAHRAALPHGHVGHYGPGHIPASPITHCDGEIVLHVLPYDPAPYGLNAPAPLPWLVSVQVPPGCIQDTEDPESCEQETNEDHNADLGWGGKQEPSSVVRGVKDFHPYAQHQQHCPVQPSPQAEGVSLPSPQRGRNAAHPVSHWEPGFEAR